MSQSEENFEDPVEMDFSEPAMPSSAIMSPGPGQLLCAAREAAGLSIRDVSAQMHLDEPIIENLEQDRFDRLPASTFVRGYLRGYARLLNIPVEPVIDAYNRQGFEPPALVADIADSPQARTSDWTMQLVTLLVIIVVVTPVFLWWRAQYQNGLNDVNNDNTSIEAPTLNDENDGNVLLPRPGDDNSAAADGPGAGLVFPPERLVFGGENSPLSNESGQAAGAETENASNSQSATSDNTTPSTVENLANGNAATTGESTSENPAGATSEGTTATVGATDSASATADESATASAPDTSDGNSAVFEFRRDSWLEVYDANNKRLFYDIAKAETPYEVKGISPMRVILGRPETVDINYNGERVNMRPYLEQGLSKIFLGE